MKLAVFTTKEQYADNLRQQIRVAQRAIARETKLLELETEDGPDRFCQMNRIQTEDAQYEWERHLEWRRGYIRHYERKLKKATAELKKIENA